MDDTGEIVHQYSDPIITFKDKIEGALQSFANMSPTQRAESIILWNIVSDKLQGILNKSVDAMNEISIIVVRNNNRDSVPADLAESSGDSVLEAKSIAEQSDACAVEVSATSEIISQNSSGSISESTVSDSGSVVVTLKDTTAPNLLGRSEDNILEIKHSTHLNKVQKVPNIELNAQNTRILVTTATSDLIKLNPNIMKEYSRPSIIEYDNLSLESSSSSCKESSLKLDLGSIDADSKHSKILLSSLSRKKNNKHPSEAIIVPNNKKIDLVVEKNRWSCNSCEKQFDDYLLLQSHIQCDHSLSKHKPIKCNLCDTNLSTKSNYIVHLRQHSGERPFSCGKCSVRFTTSNNLRRHMLSHQGVKPYRCSVCDVQFTEKRSLQIHHRTHTGERPYKCTECDSSFRQKSVLRSHMATHSQEKPFICSTCGQTFKKKNLLRSHENRHTGEKKYDCHYCKSAFVTKSDLNRHEQSHRAEKRFTCQEENCNMSYMRKQSLREHMNRHQGIKPYKCDKCSNSYPQLSEFKKHYKKHSE